MIAKPRWEIILSLILAVGSSARAADEMAVVKRALALLEEISSSPDSGIPSQFLQEARGIMIMPHIVETQLGVGRKKGRGVYLRRDEKGKWDSPRSVVISNTSAGAVAGREVTDMVVIYRTQKAADKYYADTSIFSLGANGSFLWATKHPHQFSGPKSDDKLNNDVLVYERNMGIRIAVAIIGECRFRPSTAQMKSKTPPTGEQKTAADGEVTVKVAKD